MANILLNIAALAIAIGALSQAITSKTLFSRCFNIAAGLGAFLFFINVTR